MPASSSTISTLCFTTDEPLVRFATPDPNPPAQSPGRPGYSSTSVVDPGRLLVPVHALNPVLLDAQDDPILRDVADGTARHVVHAPESEQARLHFQERLAGRRARARRGRTD